MSLVLSSINPKTTLAKKLLSLGALLAVVLASFASPHDTAHAVSRDVGNLSVDCDSSDDGYLEGQVVVFLAPGDTFTIQNANYEDCLISDPNNILTGENADFSGGGPGILGLDERTDPITIDASGTFTITEDGGAGNTKTFQVRNGLVFANPEGEIGNDAIVGNTFLYDDVARLSDGSSVSATITVTAVSNLVDNAFNVDRDERPDTDAGIGNRIEKDNDNPGYAEYTVTFHAPGNPSSTIALSDFAVTIKDIDNLQWVSVVGASSYSLSSTPVTTLAARTVGDALYVEELNDIESSSEDEDHWAVFNFNSKSSVTIRVGDNYESSGTSSFNVLFSDVEWESSPTVINFTSAGLADTGVDGTGLSGTLAIAGLLTSVGIATMIVRRRRAIV